MYVCELTQPSPGQTSSVPFEVHITYTDGKQDVFKNIEQVQPTPVGVAMINQEGLVGFVPYQILQSVRIPARESGLTLPAGLALPPGMVAVS